MVCGCYVGTVRPDARGIVRVNMGHVPPPPFYGGYDRRCVNCHMALEVFTVALSYFDMVDTLERRG